MARAAYVLGCLSLFALAGIAYYWLTHAYGREFGRGFALGVGAMALVASAYLTLRYGE